MTNPTPPTSGPSGPPKTTPATNKSKPDLWTQVMIYGLIVGMLDAYNLEVTQTASAMKNMLDNYYNKLGAIAEKIKSRGMQHQIRTGDGKYPDKDPTYESDMATLNTEKNQVQLQISQTEATLNGVLQAASNNIKYAMATVTEIGQELSKIIGQAGG